MPASALPPLATIPFATPRSPSPPLALPVQTLAFLQLSICPCLLPLSIHQYNHLSKQWTRFPLKHADIRGINHMQWCPLGGRLLAVACQTGIGIWKFSVPPSRSSRAVLSMLKLESDVNVTQVEWSSCGRWLACSSGSGVWVWDAAKGLAGMLARPPAAARLPAYLHACMHA